MRYLLILAFFLAAWPGPGLAQSPGGDAAKFEQGKALYETRKFEQAFEILRPLAEAGHAEAQYIMGRAYEKGSGPILFDAVTSLDWLLKAAKGSSIAAQRRLTELLIFSGRPFAPDEASARFTLTYDLVDDKFLRYVRLLAAEEYVIAHYHDPTTVALPRGEIFKTMWLILLAGTDYWWAELRLYFHRLLQPARDTAMAEKLVDEWLHGELETWVRTELVRLVEKAD